MKPTVYLHGKEEKFDLSRQKQGLKKEVGIFETFRVYGGKFFRLREHLTRLEESAKTAGFSGVISQKKLTNDLKVSIEKFYAKKKLSTKKPVSVRLTYFGDEPYVMIWDRTHPKWIYEEGVRLKTSPVKRSHSNAMPPEVKTSAYHNSLLAHLEPRSPEIYEWLFLNGEGFVNEVTIGNLFMLKKRSKKMSLQTPPTAGILNGVTRQFVIECALQVGIPCEESPLTRHDLYNADEVFLTNSSWEILPVREIDSRKIGTGKPGPQTLNLGKKFQANIQRECL